MAHTTASALGMPIEMIGYRGKSMTSPVAVAAVVITGALATAGTIAVAEARNGREANFALAVVKICSSVSR